MAEKLCCLFYVIGNCSAIPMTQKSAPLWMRTRAKGRCCLMATALGASVRFNAHTFLFQQKLRIGSIFVQKNSGIRYQILLDGREKRFCFLTPTIAPPILSDFA